MRSRPAPVVGRATDNVVRMKQRIAGQPFDVLVLRRVEDPIAIATSPHESSEPQLGEVL